MASSQGFLLWLLINNLENNVQFQQILWKRSLTESYQSESCPSLRNDELNSYLWVMDRNPPVYFFGTIHVPYTNVWDYIPLNSKRAFKTASNVYFELDSTDRESLRALERCKLLPNGVKLREVLPTRLYKRVKRHLSYIRGKLSEWISKEQQKIMRLTSLSLYQRLTKNWHKKRPIWIMLLLNKLTKYSVQLMSQRLADLDTYLRDEALANHKKLGSIESVEEHCSILNKFNNSKVILALNQTLLMHEKIRRGEENHPFTIKQLINHYNCGNLKNVLFSQETPNSANISERKSLQKEQAQRFHEYMKEELIYSRNRKMASRIVKIVNEQPKRRILFAFGAGHFIGNRSIISILQSQGYNVTHLKASDTLPRYGPNRKGKHCKTRKKKKGRRNGRKQKRRRYRAPKYCNNDIPRQNWQKPVTTPKTIACTSCSTQEKDGLVMERSSSVSIDDGQRLWTAMLFPMMALSMVGL